MLDIMYEIPHREGVIEVLIDRGVVLGRKKPIVKVAPSVADKDAA
jgi:ATP-dependent protease Clp ATPase subunit